MRALPELPDLLTRADAAIRAAGGRAYLVGGCVRDHLLGRPMKDWDVEAYGLEEQVLHRVLRSVGPVNAVGKSFGVYKLGPGGREIDVSLPRRDSNAGPGHRGIAVEGDPHMSIAEAARRRDLTINAMLVDLDTRELIDPHGGAADLKAGLLRAVDEHTFLEDPLRALRAVQFAARLGFTPTPSLIDLCRRAQLDELPAERVQGEWLKLLLGSQHPSVGLRVARDADILARVFPDAPQDDRVDASVDAAATRRDTLQHEGRRLALMLSAWLHPCTAPAAQATLDRLWLHKWQGYPLRDRVLAAIAHRLDPIASDAELRWLSTRAEVELTLELRQASTGEDLAERRMWAQALGIAHEPPEPLLRGRDLLGRLDPGPHMGTLLRAAYEAQLDGKVSTTDEALSLVAGLS